MFKKKKHAIALIITLTIVVSFIAGCSGAQEKPTGEEFSIQTFRDIPGITTEEMEAIEELLTKRDSFSFGALLSTYAFILPDGSYAGFFPLFCDLLTQLFGVPFTIDFYDWDTLNENLNDLSMDFTGELTPTPERLLKYSMTSAIAEHSIAAYINIGAVEITSAQSLNGLKVGFWSQSITEYFLLLAYPDLVYESVDIDTEADVARKLLSGEIDAFVAPTVDAYVLKDYPFIIGREVFPFVYGIASLTTANPELEPIITVIDKYLVGAGFYPIHDLHVEGRREFTAYNLMHSFTDEEKQYINYNIENNIKIPIFVEGSRYPITFYNETDGEFQGMAQDILAEISRLTGLEFEVVNDRSTAWRDLLAVLDSGQAAMITDLWYSDDREDRFIWSQERYFTSKYAFLSKIETPYTDFLIPILRTGVVEGTVFEDVYHTFFPDGGNLVLYDTHTNALNALEQGEIDFLLTADFFLLYQTNYRERSGYKINILLDYLTGDSYFGFNKDEELLCSIISKAQRFVDVDRIALSWTGRVFDYERKMADERADNAIISMITLSLFTFALLALLIVLAISFRKNKKMLKELRFTSAKLETALVQTNAASKAKSDFLSNMSHEIRTPLNAIVGMITIGKKTGSLKEKNKAMDEIGDASSHLLGVINDVLDMAKIEADKFELANTTFSFEKMLQKVLTTIRFRADEKKHKLIINIDSAIPQFIVADEQRLSQIIMNLLSNAVKFTQAGGKIYFDAYLAGKTGEDIELRIEVSDSGIGISPEQHNKLFDAFEQANSGVNREYGGTGLGLAIAKRIVEMMGGRIWVESELGKGSKFAFTVKASCGNEKNTESSDSAGVESAGAFKGKQLLVAEDVELNSKILIALLSDTGIAIKCVENGKEALHEIEANPDKYDIVLMDLQMPQMDGLEATKRIRALPGHNRDKLPIVAMTANVFKDDIDNCIAVGMDDHLSKPLDIEIVIKKMHKYLKGAFHDNC